MISLAVVAPVPFSIQDPLAFPTSVMGFVGCGMKTTNTT